MGRLAGYWRRLPESVAGRLLAGSVGRRHVAAAAALAVEAASQDPAKAGFRLALARELLCAGFAADPLDGGYAASLTGLPGGNAPGGPLARLTDLARAVARQTRALPDEADRDPEALLKLQPDNPAALRLAAISAVRRGRAAGFAANRPADLPPGKIAPALAKLAADLALLSGDPAGAEAGYRALSPVFGDLSDDRLAEAVAAQGRRDEATAILRRVVAARPWRVNALLRLYDLETGRDAETAMPPGSVAVLLYSFNKAEHLARTLAALFASDLDGATVFLLDNGSTDATPEAARTFAERFGTGRLTTIRLPVNVGAPAARNWLMALPEVKGRDFTAYLDDDATVPPDWLGRLGAAARAYPLAGVWGCRVVEEDNARIIQHADLHLFARPDPERFSLSSHHLEEFDFGQFAFIRPCASVTGCCHLFRTERLLAAGPFDLRYSPSQFDDLDHDLRLLEMGLVPVCQGHLAVGHVRTAGKAEERRPGGTGNAAGNLHKLRLRHSAETYAALAATEARALLDDVLAKAAMLRL